MKNFSIKVPFSKAEVVTKIKDRFRDFNCEESSGEIIVSYPIRYRNDFAPHFYLTFEENEYETTINGQVKMRSWVRIFCFFWLALIGLAAISIFISTYADISRGEKSFSELKFVLFPVGMIVFILVLIKFGAFIARNNTEAILDMFFNLFPNHTIVENGK